MLHQYTTAQSDTILTSIIHRCRFADIHHFNFPVYFSPYGGVNFGVRQLLTVRKSPNVPFKPVGRPILTRRRFSGGSRVTKSGKAPSSQGDSRHVTLYHNRLTSFVFWPIKTVSHITYSLLCWRGLKTLHNPIRSTRQIWTNIWTYTTDIFHHYLNFTSDQKHINVNVM